MESEYQCNNKMCNSIPFTLREGVLLVCPFCDDDDISILCPQCGSTYDEDTGYCSQCKEIIA